MMTHGSLPMRHRGFERLREGRHGVAPAQEMDKIEDETWESALKKCVSLISTMLQFLEIESEGPYALDKLTGTVLVLCNSQRSRGTQPVLKYIATASRKGSALYRRLQREACSY